MIINQWKESSICGRKMINEKVTKFLKVELKYKNQEIYLKNLTPINDNSW